MTDQTLESLPKTVTELNQLPLSQHVLTMFKREKVTPEPGLALVALIFWAKENLEVQPEWVETLAGAAAQAELDDPQATHWNLAVPQITDSQTLEQAAMLLMQRLADLTKTA